MKEKIINLLTEMAEEDHESLGWESCCSCGGWAEGEEERLCTEEIEYQAINHK